MTNRWPGGPVELSLPFTGRWLVQNSPARRVPSHGVDVFGQRYAIDFVGVDERDRTAGVRDWRTWLATEPPERFVAFGRPILAPASGTVVGLHDGEPDHEARRSQLALVPYALGQTARLRRGPAALAGNSVTIAVDGGRAFVTLAHLRAGSLRVVIGQDVLGGEPIAECGNSGNSTQPHVHVQVTDRAEPSVARGVPIAFRRFRECPAGAAEFRDRQSAVPGERAVEQPLLAGGS